MLVDLIVDAVKSVLRGEEKLLSDYVAMRSRQENWLRDKIYERLKGSLGELVIEKSYPSPNANDHCDFWCREQDGRESWVELKVCATNYVPSFGRFSQRPITQEIRAIIRDLKRLQRIPVASSHRHVLLLAYPMEPDYKRHAAWRDHLDKLQKSSRVITDVLAMPVEKDGKTALVVGYRIEV